MELRKVLNFNKGWRFIDRDVEEAREKGFDDSKFEEICLPHSNRIFPHHYFSEERYRFVSWYRKRFHLNKEYESCKIVIEFEGVMTVATVFVNGQEMCVHKGGYTGFTCDITSAVDFGSENVIAVRVDSRSHRDVPPEGANVDYMQFGGIYRNVWLKILSSLHVSDLFVIPDEVSPSEATIRMRIEVKNAYEDDRAAIVSTRILSEDGKPISEEKVETNIDRRSTTVLQVVHVLQAPNLWSIKTPYLYTAEVTLINAQGEILDKVRQRFGVRKVEFRKDGKFYLNGEPIKLRGLDRHQIFPYLGAAMPDRIQRKDADILRFDLGLNFVRSSHYPPAPSFLDRCDEIGLLVFEEIPGWVYIGDDSWKEIAKANLKEMILRDRNHPSIILWGVRINESFDDHDFYIETNRIAHELDPSRPTGGVRYFFYSEFLEDVFTVNDFEANLDGKLHTPPRKPCIVTEYMGHMYPTRAYDREERLIQHAKLHAKIQSCSYGIPDLAGACGWCAFDYYTTSAFGAGDHICYHGVCDIFRLPKFAAYFYQSQMDPDEKVVLFIARYLTPEFNDCGDELIVFSNCEQVALYIDGEFFDSQTPDYANYPNLPHPPFTFKGIQASFKGKRPSKWEAIYEWTPMHWAVGRWFGSRIEKIEAVGFINGKEVARHAIQMFGEATRIILEPDDHELVADGTDCTRVVVKVVDEKEQVLPLSHHPITFSMSGPGRIIGDNPLSVERGMGAVYVGAALHPGTITVKAMCQGLEGDEVQIRVKPTDEVG